MFDKVLIKYLDEESRNELIDEVGTKAFQFADSWEGELGLFLAYLFWGIACNNYVDLWTDSPSYMLFTAWFPQQHDVWKFIRIQTKK